MIFLKQSTVTDVVIGPFVDSTTGSDTEEALTLAQADLQLSKNGGTAAQKNDTSSASHLYGGHYKVDLNATDTNTLGHLRLMCKESGALPIMIDFMVVTANWYDTMCSTDQLDVNVTNVAGTSQTANDNGADINAILQDTSVDLPTAMGAQFVLIQGTTFNTSTDSLEAIRNRGDAAWTTGAGGSDRLLMIDTTIATLASQTSFTLTAGSSDDNAYNNCTIIIEDVSTSTQKSVGMVLDYTGSTKTITLKEALSFTITTTDKVYILAENSLKSTIANRQLDITSNGNAGIDWANVENPTTALDLSGTDIQLVDTTTTNTDMRGTDSAALASALATVDTNVDTLITNVPDIVSLANINAQVDTALSDYDGPTNTEMIARTLPSADYVVTTDTIAGVTLVATTTDVTNQVTADVTEISGDSVAADNLELMYDGTGYTDDTAPSSRSQLDTIANVGAAINTPSESFTLTNGNQVANTYTSTAALDGIYHQIDDADGSTGTIDCYYQFDIGGSGVPTSVTMTGYINGANDDHDVFAYNWGTTTWDQIGIFNGKNISNNDVNNYNLYTTHVGTGVNLGKVRIRLYQTGLSSPDIYMDQIYLSYAIVAQSVGYADGAIWIDTNASNTNTESYVDGVADNPVSTWAAVKTLLTNMGLSNVRVINGSTITLDANSDGLNFVGEAWMLALGGQSIDGCSFYGADVTGIGEATTTHPLFENCHIGAATIPPGHLDKCGIGDASGTFTGASTGQYIFTNCYSLVPGSGSPAFVFTGLGGTVGINNRTWAGGSTYTLDSACTLSHEVLAGGGTTITTGGANVEVRGICRALTLILSGANTCQFAGITGPVTISGTTTATVNLFGISSSISDTSVTATVNDNTTSSADHDLILADTNELQTDWTNGGRLDLLLDDIPTVAEFNARTIPSADYVVTTDTIAGVTLVATTTDVTNQVDADVTSVDGTAQRATDLAELSQYLIANSATLTSVVADDSIIAKMIATDGDISGFNEATDALQAIRDRGDSDWVTGAGGSDRLLMVDTTIATLSTQTSFTLTAGSSDNDAYNNCTIIVEDISTSTQKAVGMVLDYIGSSKTITLKEALAFTIATTDKVYILAENSIKSTVANRQLDVTANGTAGIDWGNVENPTTALDLAGTDIQLVDTVTTNTDMRGTDSAALATALVTVDTNVDTLITNVPDIVSLANINTQVDTALSDYDGPTNTEMVASFTEIKGSTWNSSTDTLEAIRDRGDAAWTTGASGITDIINIQPLIPKDIDLANTATYRIGLMLINSLDDLPSTAEITPGTISIDRKAIGSATWSSIVSDAACSEIAGLVYYDEVFDSGTGYAEGDSIRFTLKNQKITVAANDYEIIGATGRIFYTNVRQTMRGTDSAALASALSTHDGKLDTAQLDLDIITGTNGVTLATAQGNYAPSKAGDLMGLANDAITSAKYDESTAFPIKSIDSGITLIARTGADGDTLETLSDEISGVSGVTPAEVKAEVVEALSDIKLDHLVAVADADDPVNDSIIAKMVSTTGDWSTFTDTTDSLQSLRDNLASASSLATHDGKLDIVDANVDFILEDTNELQVDWTNGGRLDLILDSTNSIVGAQNNLSAAQVNAEVVDVLRTDTVSEMGQGAPPASPSIEQAINYLYRMFRNKSLTVANGIEIYDDAGSTVLFKATLSDDLTTLFKSEYVTGA